MWLSSSDPSLWDLYLLVCLLLSYGIVSFSIHLFSQVMPVFFFGFFFPHITSCVLRTFFPRHIPTNSLSSVKGMRFVRNLRVREGERRGGRENWEKDVVWHFPCSFAAGEDEGALANLLCKSNQSCKCVIDGVGQQGAQVKRFTVRFLPRGQNFLQPCFTRLAQFMKLCCKMFGAVLSSRLESYLSDCSVKSTVFMFLGCLKCLPGLIKLDIKFFFFFFL